MSKSLGERMRKALWDDGHHDPDKRFERALAPIIAEHESAAARAATLAVVAEVRKRLSELHQEFYDRDMESPVGSAWGEAADLLDEAISDLAMTQKSVDEP